jgi:hypothetical protein
MGDGSRMSWSYERGRFKMCCHYKIDKSRDKEKMKTESLVITGALRAGGEEMSVNGSNKHSKHVGTK